MTILIVLCGLDLTLGRPLVQCPLTLSDPRSGGWEGGAAPVTVLECNRLMGASSPCSCELTEGRMAPPSSRYPQCWERAPERNSVNMLYKLLVNAKEGTFGSRRRCQAMIFELDSVWLMDLEWGEEYCFKRGFSDRSSVWDGSVQGGRWADWLPDCPA